MARNKRITIADSKTTARIVLEGNHLYFEWGMSYGLAYIKVDISDMFPKLMHEMIGFAKAGGFDEFIKEKQP